MKLLSVIKLVRKHIKLGKLALVLSLLLIGGQAWGASITLYVSPSGNTANTGLSWAQAKAEPNQATSLGAATVPTGTGYGEGHTYYIAPGVYASGFDMTSDNNAGATIIGTLAHGSTAEGVAENIIIGTIIAKTNLTAKHLNLVNTGASYAITIGTSRSMVGVDIEIIDSAGYGIQCGGSAVCTFSNLKIKNAVNMCLVQNGTLTVNGGIFENNRARVVMAENGTAILNNVDFIGNDVEVVNIVSWANAATAVTLNNPILVANSAANRGKYILDNQKSGATLAVNNGLWHPNPRVIDRSTTDYRTRAATINGSSISKSPQFVSPNKTGILVIGVDDDASIAVAEALGVKLKNAGMKLSYAVDENAATGNNNWARIAAIANDGHEILSHTRSHSKLTDLTGITLTFDPGASGATTATAAYNATTHVLSTVSDVGACSFTKSTSGLKISDIVTWINALGGCGGGGTWTAAGGTWTAMLANSIAEKGATDCFSASPAVAYPLDATAFYADEITTSKTSIASKIIAAGGPAGYTVTGFVHPGDFSDDTVRAAVQAAGYIGSRGDYAGNWNMSTGVKLFYVGDSLVDSTITHTNVEANISSLCELLNYVGGITFLYTHSFATVTETDWDTIISVIQESGTMVMTFSQAVQWMIDNGIESGSGATTTMTVTQASAANLRLAKSSPAIGSGVLITGYHDQATPATDYAGTPVTWGPPIGAYQPTGTAPIWAGLNGAKLIRSSQAVTITGDHSAETLDLSNAINAGQLTVSGTFSLGKIIGNASVPIVGSNARITGPLELGDNVKMHGFSFVHE